MCSSSAPPALGLDPGFLPVASAGSLHLHGKGAASAALLRLCITNNSGANNLKKPTEMKQNTLAPVTHLTDSFHSFCQLKATSELKRFPFLSVLSFLASSADFFPVYLISN